MRNQYRMFVAPAQNNPLRLWPGVVAVTLQWFLRYGLPLVMPDALEFSVISALFSGIAIVIWWAFFSRAPWVDRLGGIALMVGGLFATKRIVDPSIATGMMGMMLFVYAIPVLCLALVVSAVVAGRLPNTPRRLAIAAAILAACLGWTLVRTNGMTGYAKSDFAFRWAESAEDRLVARAPALAAPPPVATVPVSTPVATAPEPPATAANLPAPAPIVTANTGTGWPGFRGPSRNGLVAGSHIETDWSKKPPVEMWRGPVGPGWSSFAVQGNLIYTQEQRGADEVVACYNASTGKPVWLHRDTARFWESNAGAGPRSTPTLHNGRLYTFGATGIANALDAATGTVVWTRNAASENGVKTPEWGFASSPLVIDDVVVIAVAGELVAYDLATGNPRWKGPDGGVSYSSPQLVTIDGVPQILVLSQSGVASVAVADGALLWKHAWHGYPIVQPAVTAEGDVLLGISESSGLRRLAISHTGPWTPEERWTSPGLKPYFNDFVVHDGYAFGFDGGIISCIDLKDGKRKWKGGRYGHGQLLMLPDQNVLLVLSEEGELALVAASHDQFTELARVPALSGKTWNHPVLAGELLLVRNGQEMAAFRLVPAL